MSDVADFPSSPALFDLPGPLPEPRAFVPRNRGATDGSTTTANDEVPPSAHATQSRFSLKAFTSFTAGRSLPNSKLPKEDSENKQPVATEKKKKTTASTSTAQPVSDEKEKADEGDKTTAVGDKPKGRLTSLDLSKKTELPPLPDSTETETMLTLPETDLSADMLQSIYWDKSADDHVEVARDGDVINNELKPQNMVQQIFEAEKEFSGVKQFLTLDTKLTGRRGSNTPHEDDLTTARPLSPELATAVPDKDIEAIVQSPTSPASDESPLTPEDEEPAPVTVLEPIRSKYTAPSRPIPIPIPRAEPSPVQEIEIPEPEEEEAPARRTPRRPIPSPPPTPAKFATSPPPSRPIPDPHQSHSRAPSQAPSQAPSRTHSRTHSRAPSRAPPPTPPPVITTFRPRALPVAVDGFGDLEMEMEMTDEPMEIPSDIPDSARSSKFNSRSNSRAPSPVESSSPTTIKPSSIRAPSPIRRPPVPITRRNTEVSTSPPKAGTGYRPLSRRPSVASPDDHPPAPQVSVSPNQRPPVPATKPRGRTMDVRPTADSPPPTRSGSTSRSNSIGRSNPVSRSNSVSHIEPVAAPLNRSTSRSRPPVPPGKPFRSATMGPSSSSATEKVHIGSPPSSAAHSRNASVGSGYTQDTVPSVLRGLKRLPSYNVEPEAAEEASSDQDDEEEGPKDVRSLIGRLEGKGPLDRRPKAAVEEPEDAEATPTATRPQPSLRRTLPLGGSVAKPSGVVSAKTFNGVDRVETSEFGLLKKSAAAKKEEEDEEEMKPLPPPRGRSHWGAPASALALGLVVGRGGVVKSLVDREQE